MLPILQIGPLALQTPGLILILGVWLGLNTAEKFAARFKSASNPIYNLVLLGLLAGTVGARLAYALQYFSIFKADPFSLFSLTSTMLNGEAGLISGVLVALIYGYRKGLQLWPTLDTLAVGLSVFFIAWHLANFASGNAFGTPAALPWAVNLWGEQRHPVQIYEMVVAIAIVIFILPRQNSTAQPGITCWTWIALTALARLFFELFRGDSTTLVWNLHIAQIIAWLVAGIALWQIGRIRGQPSNPPAQPAITSEPSPEIH